MNRSRYAHAAGYAVSLAVVSLALAWFEGSPAAAQMYPSPAPYYGVAPGQVLARVQSLGLRPVSEPRLRGPVWVVRAVGREGTLVRVLVDAGSGRVVNMVAIDQPYPPRLASSGGPASEGPWVPMRGPGYGNDLPPSAGGGYGPPPMGEGYQYPGAHGPGPQSSRGPAVDPQMGMPPEFRKGANGNAVQPEKKVASHPATPLPKPRPADAPQDASKKDAPTVATAPKEPEITGSVPASEKKDGVSAAAPAKASIPVSPLE
jgi:hypothetical protein